MISPKKIKDIQTPAGIVCIGDLVYFYYKDTVQKGTVTAIDSKKPSLEVYFSDETGGRTIELTTYDVLDCCPKYNSSNGVIKKIEYYASEDSCDDVEQNCVVTEDIVNPKRYTSKGNLECWDVIIDQEMSYLEGCVLKYLWRYKQKNGIQDLEKAKVYIDKIISELQKKVHETID